MNHKNNVIRHNTKTVREKANLHYLQSSIRCPRLSRASPECRAPVASQCRAPSCLGCFWLPSLRRTRADACAPRYVATRIDRYRVRCLNSRASGARTRPERKVWCWGRTDQLFMSYAVRERETIDLIWPLHGIIATKNVEKWSGFGKLLSHKNHGR